MWLKPPHLEDEDALAREEILGKDFSKIGKQWPSKYGPGGSKRFKALGGKKKR